ncbi:MAG: TlyA family RNA methyltransferase [Parvibaculum sp.]
MTERLDRALVSRGLVATRARAQAEIKAGRVSVDGSVVAKPAQAIADHAEISLAASKNNFVSRAALKLVHGLDEFHVAAEGKIALDVGASTGGFTQVLLERGALRVYAVDVGHGQLADEVGRDPRVRSLEGVNAKHLTAEIIHEPPSIIVSDVSFIGLEKALPAALALAAPGAHLIALIKPQFEVGPGKVGRGGIVKDETLHEEVRTRIQRWLSEDMGWDVLGIIDSPITGGDGNKEFLIGARRP